MPYSMLSVKSNGEPNTDKAINSEICSSELLPMSLNRKTNSFRIGKIKLQH